MAKPNLKYNLKIQLLQQKNANEIQILAVFPEAEAHFNVKQGLILSENESSTSSWETIKVFDCEFTDADLKRFATITKIPKT